MRNDFGVVIVRACLPIVRGLAIPIHVSLIPYYSHRFLLVMPHEVAGDKHGALSPHEEPVRHFPASRTAPWRLASRAIASSPDGHRERPPKSPEAEQHERQREQASSEEVPPVRTAGRHADAEAQEEDSVGLRATAFPAWAASRV